MLKGWFVSADTDNASQDSASISSHDDDNFGDLTQDFSFHSQHERRPLVPSFEHDELHESFSESQSDYGSTAQIPYGSGRIKSTKKYPPLTASSISSVLDASLEHSVQSSNGVNGERRTIKRMRSSPAITNNNTASTLDSSHHSYTSTGSRIVNLREKFKEFRQNSALSISESVREIRKAIAEHTGSIGMLGSLSIAINNLTGPAMLSLPATFARSGIIPTACTLIFVASLSSLCSLHMANVISKVPQNEDFQQGVEFPEAFRTFWGRKWFVAANWLFFACITVLNVSSLVDNAQVLDTFLAHYNPLGGAWALVIDPIHHSASWTSWDPSVCSDKQLYDGGCVPFESVEWEHDNQIFLITLGYVVTAILFLPLAMMDLAENVAWQIFGFFILILVSIQFIVTFATSELDVSHITWWGESHDSLLGVVLFNFALVVTVPAWLYEKEPHVDIPTVMHTSTTASTVLYLLIGILGCLAMPDVSDNFLESIMSGALGPAMQIGSSIFSFFIIGLNIPLFSILTRLSLMGGANELRAAHYGNQFCSRKIANVLAVYLPFGLSWMLYQGSKVTLLLSWGGMIFTSLVAFLLPLALALYVVETKYGDCKGSVKVYPWGLSEILSSKESQVRALKVLLAVSTVAVVAAIAGNVLAGSDPTPRKLSVH